jgi:hypothetical protein
MKYFKVFLPFFLIFFLLLFSGNKLNAQLNCDISISQAIPVCPNIDFELSTQFYDNCTYVWEKNGNEIIGENGNTIITQIAETSSFTVTITDNGTSEVCTSMPFEVTTHIPIEIDFVQFQLTCTNGDEPNGNTAVVKAIATGAFEPDEYHYYWQDVAYFQIDPNDSSIVNSLKAHQKYAIEVRDNYGCPAWDTVRTDAYPNPIIEVYTDPDTAFIENPYVTFSFVNLSEDSIQVSNHYWNFGDCVEGSVNYPQCLDDVSTSQYAPVHAYGNPITRDTTYYASLIVYNQQGCDTTYVKDVLVKLVDLFIPNVFTPNGDGINDYFIITENQNSGGTNERAEYDNYDVLGKYYESSQLVVFNRWGRVVYESNNYQNDWDGGNLPDGVYFYVLKCQGYSNPDNDFVYKGSVTIFGSGR